MPLSSRLHRLSLGLFLAAFCSTLAAQGPLEPPSSTASSAPQEFGVSGDHVTIVDAYDFDALSSAIAVEENFGAKWPHSGPAGVSSLGASLNGRIPQGAVITSMCLFGEDNTALGGDNIEILLYRYLVDAVDGETPARNTAATVSSFGSPGDFVACANGLNIPFRSRYDFSGDGDIEYVDFRLEAQFGDGLDVYGGVLRLRFVRLTWHRRVSPAPGAATFGDVPTSHPYFAFVEALVASGITAGCGGGNYCVNSPITRGEMAVFLAAALGLYWPPI